MGDGSRHAQRSSSRKIWDNFASTYPACASIPTGVDPSPVHVAVRAFMHDVPANFGSPVRATFGMALWLAPLVEIYVRASSLALARLLWTPSAAPTANLTRSSLTRSSWKHSND